MTTHNATGLDPALLDLAREQRGAFTTRQALLAGMSPFALVEAVRAGILLHPGRGLYAVAALAHPDNPESWHTSLAMGATLMYPDAVLTGASALIAHGIPVWNADLARVHLLRTVDRSAGMAAFRVRRWRGQPAIPTELGPAVPAADALAQNAIDHGIVAGVVSADFAMHEGLVTSEDVATAVEVIARWRHGSRAVAMASFADGRRESVGESRCAVALSMLGIALDPQIKIRDRNGAFVARVDFQVRGTRVLIEFDGRTKYASGEPGVLWAEKKREDRLRSLGYVVVRVVWADLNRPGALAARVRAAIAAAA